MVEHRLVEPVVAGSIPVAHPNPSSRRGFPLRSRHDHGLLGGVIRAGARAALSAGFLSAVADRFGWWGRPGDAGVVWGNFQAFLDYTQVLNPFVPTVAIPWLGWTVTSLELILAVLLFLPVGRPWVAVTSGVLLTMFGVAMAASTGIKAPLDFSVFSAAAAAFLLAQSEAVARRR